MTWAPPSRACCMPRTKSELLPVCRAARKIIRAEGLARKVTTYAADMTREIAPGYDVILFWDIGAIPQRSFALAYRALPRGGLVLVGGCFGDAVDRSLNLLTRELTLVYPDHDTVQQTVAKLKAAGFSRVRRTRIKDAGRVVIGNK